MKDGRSKGKSVYLHLWPLRPTLIDTVFDTVVHVLPAIPKSRPRGISVDLAPSHAGHSQIKLVTREAALQSTVAALCLNSLLPLTKASPARVSGDS